MKNKSAVRFLENKVRLLFPCLSKCWGMAIVIPLAFVCFIPCSWSETTEETRMYLEKWVETQRVISQEKRDFALSKEMLNERIDLVRQEIENLHQRIDDASKSIAEADKKRATLLEQNQTLKESAGVLEENLEAMEKRVLLVLPKLPPPIRERIKPLSQRIPVSSTDENVSLSNRFQNVVGLLNEVDKFQREISVTSEVLSLPDGTSAEVTAVYLGISKGYYTGKNGTIAGIGMPAEKGWEWQTANESAEQIAQIVGILKNEQIATFVQVPAEIK